MQLRFATNISVEQYIQQEAWKYAELDQCPLHPEGNAIRLRFKAIRLRNCSVSRPIGHIAKICVFFLFSFDGCHFG